MVPENIVTDFRQIQIQREIKYSEPWFHVHIVIIYIQKYMYVYIITLTEIYHLNSETKVEGPVLPLSGLSLQWLIQVKSMCALN